MSYGHILVDNSSCVLQRFCLIHKTGDLFSCDKSESLAHCVSRDLRMGKGIAVLFKKIFGCVDELKDQGRFYKELGNIKTPYQMVDTDRRPFCTVIDF